MHEIYKHTNTGNIMRYDTVLYKLTLQCHSNSPYIKEDLKLAIVC